jgi:hypothetical protein
MKGTIRVLLGFLLVFGAVGTLDYDPTASMLQQTLIAIVGIISLRSGVSAMEKQYD